MLLIRCKGEGNTRKGDASNLIKRTRRNLSDPRIKKIIKTQISRLTGLSNNRLHKTDEKTAGRLFLIFVLFLLFSVSVLLAYLNWNDINRFFNNAFSSKPSARATQNYNPGASSQPPATSEKLAEEEPQNNSGDNNPPAQTSFPAVARHLQVEVLNGCGTPGLAKQITLFLRQKEVDVVSQGNYLNFNVRKTMILDRTDNPERARQLADVLGVSTQQIQVKKDSNLQLDATLVLGADYKSLKPFK